MAVKRKISVNILIIAVVLITITVFLINISVQKKRINIGDYYTEEMVALPMMNQENGILEQRFVTVYDGIKQIDIRLGIDTDYTEESVTVLLADAENNILAERTVSLDDFDRYTYVTLNIEEDISEGEELCLKLEQSEQSEHGFFGFVASKSRTDGINATFGGKELDSALDAVYIYEYEEIAWKSVIQKIGLLWVAVFSLYGIIK